MTSQSGGGGGIKGVTSDGQTPGGVVIAGALTAGDASATTVPSFSSIYGNLFILETLGNIIDGDRVVEIHQQLALPAGSDAGSALMANRSGDISLSDYQDHQISFADASGSVRDCLHVQKVSGAGMALGVVGPASFSGVIGEHGKAPALAPTAITGTITTATLAQLTAIVLQLLQALDAKGSITNDTT